MIKTIDAKIKNVFKSDGKPTNHAPRNWTSYFVPATAVDYEYVFPRDCCVRVVMTGINYE